MTNFEGGTRAKKTQTFGKNIQKSKKYLKTLFLPVFFKFTCGAENFFASLYYWVFSFIPPPPPYMQKIANSKIRVEIESAIASGETNN